MMRESRSVKKLSWFVYEEYSYKFSDRQYDFQTISQHTHKQFKKNREKTKMVDAFSIHSS